MELLVNCLFINLKERKDRLEKTLIELEKLNIKGERFNAIKNDNGALGCTLSHIACIEIAIDRNYEQIFICEDDIKIIDENKFLESLKDFNNKIKNWDVVLVSGNNFQPYYKVNVCDSCIKINNCQTTTGYIIKKNYYSKLLQNFKESAKMLVEKNNTKNWAVDVHWKKLQKEDSWFLIIPVNIVQYEGYSDIEKKNINYEDIMKKVDKQKLRNRYGFRLV